MVLDVCRFCREFDDSRNMIDPCDCYKKFDALLVHRECLQNHISDRKARMRDEIPGIHERPEYCGACMKPYRVKVQWKLGTRNRFSVKSLQAYFEAVSMGLTFIMMISALVICAFATKKERRRDGTLRSPNEDMPLLFGLGMLSTLMFYVVYRKIYRRIRHQRLEANIVDVV